LTSQSWPRASARKGPVWLHEVLEATPLDHAAAIQDDDLVGVTDRAQTVRDDDAGHAEFLEALAHRAWVTLSSALGELSTAFVKRERPLELGLA
jgi:hypothetical protein